MKTLAIILLCAFAAVQGRSAGVQNTRTAAALGENPWVVHIRFAVSTSGLLSTCAGSLIGDRWILTAASCVSDFRFAWLRYGAIDVLSPSLVTESSAARVTLHPEYDAATGANNIALIDIFRVVHSTDNIAPISLSSSDVPSSGKFCGFGEEDSQPGNSLNCFDVTLTSEDGVVTASSDDGSITEFDIGAAVVSDGQQVGVVVNAADGGATVLPVSSYLDWIAEAIEVPLNLAVVPAVEQVEVADLAY